MSTSTAEKNIAFLEHAGTALEASRKFAMDVNAEKQAATKLAEPLADVLIEAQMLEASERPLLMAKLATHDGAIEVIGNIVKYYKEKRAAWSQKLAVAQGGGDPADENGHTTKVADANGGRKQRPRFVGERAGLGVHSASDEPFRRLAGI